MAGLPNFPHCDQVCIWKQQYYCTTWLSLCKLMAWFDFGLTHLFAELFNRRSRGCFASERAEASPFFCCHARSRPHRHPCLTLDKRVRNRMHITHAIPAGREKTILRNDVQGIVQDLFGVEVGQCQIFSVQELFGVKVFWCKSCLGYLV